MKKKKKERPASNRAWHTRRLTQRCSQAAPCKINITRANFQARPFPPGLLQTRNTDVRRPRFSRRLVFLLRERGSGCGWNSIFFFSLAGDPHAVSLCFFFAPRYYVYASAVFVIARPRAARSRARGKFRNEPNQAIKVIQLYRPLSQERDDFRDAAMKSRDESLEPVRREPARIRRSIGRSPRDSLFSERSTAVDRWIPESIGLFPVLAPLIRDWVG